MSIRHATMYFEDDPETGLIDFRVDFFGPIDLRSHSHNMACQVISHLNDLAEEKRNVKINENMKVTDPPALPPPVSMGSNDGVHL